MSRKVFKCVDQCFEMYSTEGSRDLFVFLCEVEVIILRFPISESKGEKFSLIGCTGTDLFLRVCFFNEQFLECLDNMAQTEKIQGHDHPLVTFGTYHIFIDPKKDHLFPSVLGSLYFNVQLKKIAVFASELSGSKCYLCCHILSFQEIILIENLTMLFLKRYHIKK